MLKFWTLLVRFFGKMADCINEETVQNDVHHASTEVDKCEPAQTLRDNEFIDDETQIDENIKDYYAFANVSRSVEDGMQDLFLE